MILQLQVRILNIISDGVAVGVGGSNIYRQMMGEEKRRVRK